MADAVRLRRLIAYDAWADDRILDALEGLDEAELARPREAYFGSLAQGLRHLVIVQMRWLVRWDGSPLPGADHPLPPWRAAFAASSVRLSRRSSRVFSAWRVLFASASSALAFSSVSFRRWSWRRFTYSSTSTATLLRRMDGTTGTYT